MAPTLPPTAAVVAVDAGGRRAGGATVGEMVGDGETVAGDADGVLVSDVKSSVADADGDTETDGDEDEDALADADTRTLSDALGLAEDEADELALAVALAVADAEEDAEAVAEAVSVICASTALHNARRAIARSMSTVTAKRGGP
jgi:hypothetical protein